jgi:hypothetical protein
MPKAGRYIPVNSSDIITGQIFADLIEFHAATFENTVISAAGQLINGLARADLNPANIGYKLFG